MSQSLEDRLWERSEIGMALEALQMTAASYRLLTTLPTPHLVRCAFRVKLRHGPTVKARRMLDQSQAREIQQLRQGLPAGFARVLHRCGPILIEEWVHGIPLAGAAGAYLGQAGDMLRSLHNLHTSREASAEPYIAELEAGLELLKSLDHLPRHQAASLRDLALNPAPMTVLETLIHHDFCAENLVVAPNGQLHSVDNEALRFGTVELDLARVLYRWPMVLEDWKGFLASYGRPDPSDFWHVLARTRGAVARVSNRMPLADAAVSRLRELALPSTLKSKASPPFS